MLSMGPSGRTRCWPTMRFVTSAIRTLLVVAESRALAEDALELIELDVEPLPPVVDYTTAARELRAVHPDRDSNVAGAMPMPPDDELRADLRVRPARGDRAVRAEPLPRGTDGDPRDRGLVATAARFVRCLGLHPVTPRRAHRHQPHHRRAGEPDPGADGRRRRRLRPEGLPRTRRADRRARQPPPRQAAQVDRRSAREPARGDDVARRALHGHGGGRRTRARSSGSEPTTSTRSAPTRMPGAPPPWARSSSPGRTASRNSRSSRSPRSPTPARARRTADRGSSRPTSASRRSTASLGSSASIRSSCADATSCTRDELPYTLPLGHPPVRRVAGRDARAGRVDGRLRRVPRVAARAVRGRTPPGRGHRPVHRTAEHDRAVQHRTRAPPRPARRHRRRVPRLRIARARSGDDDRATRQRVPRRAVRRRHGASRATPTRRPYAFGTGGSRSGPILRCRDPGRGAATPTRR